MTCSLTLIAELDLTLAQRGAIAGLLDQAFGTDFGGRDYFVQPPMGRILARDDTGTIVGHLGLYLRRIKVGPFDGLVLGIGDVAVSSSMRGRGLGQRIVADALIQGRRRDLPFAILEGDSGIYPINGFRPVANPLRYLDVAGGTVVEAKNVDVMICTLGNQDWPEGATIDLMGPRL